MSLVRSWSFRSLALPLVALLGTAAMACSGASTSGSNNGGSGGSSTDGGGGSVGTAGTAGSGGSACVPETEICDGKDNDCNDVVDDVTNIPTCDCIIGEQQPCYTGADGTAGVGTCKQGVQDCSGGTWGECTNQVIPQTETCNLLDDDCNGTVDDMGSVSCGVGACAAVIEKCIDGQLQTCVPGQPAVEICDGLDNNCNQLTDESDPMLDANCDSGQLGVCAAGKMSCIGAALMCVPNVMPGMELCDGVDNDCDGTPDNNIIGTGGTCDTGAMGVCASGTISCQLAGGAYSIDCYGDVQASNEVCDGLDNDCNGAVDENDPEGGGACDTGLLGVCQTGTLHCVNGAVQCVQNVQSSAETCDGQDNNCDGQADEGNPGSGQACGCGGAGLTQCVNGAVSCNGGPITYFQEDFKDNSKGWTLGQTWQIGPAIGGCSGCTGTPDPALDHTPTADNGLAGVVIGGPAPTTLHDFYWLESPVFNTAGAVGNVYLQFWRQLNSDYLNFMQNAVQVYNGSAWVDLPYGLTGNCCPGVQDAGWVNHGVPAGAPLQATNGDQYPTQFDLTPYKNANMRIRFGYKIGSSGVYTIGSWSVDDVLVASAICP